MKEFEPKFMELAAKLSADNVDAGGGPFGAVIVDAQGQVVATGVNSVTRSNDPTAHAEVSAIRQACARLQSFRLTGCVVYSSCEPCPMCLSALYWAGVRKIYYGNSQEDAEAIDFSDKFIYEELARPKQQRRIPCIQAERSLTIGAFQKWAAKTDKVKY